MSLILDGTTGITPLVNSGFMGSNFRLTLTSGTPVTTSDVTAATTIYCTPYNGNRIALYDGTNWQLRSSAEFSLALGTLTSGKPYDVFCYDNAGVPTLEFLVWTNDTTRATALVYQDGVLSKTGALTRRYMGTFYTTAATTTEDSAAKRYLWNYYNRVGRSLVAALETVNTWTYNTATFRQANANTANQLDMVVGVSEDAVEATAIAMWYDSGSADTSAGVTGVGLDSTTANSAQNIVQTSNPGAARSWNMARYIGLPGAGRHYLAWLERGNTSATTTWIGDNNGPTTTQSGITGRTTA
jgi:hypothetical protein